MEEHEPRELGTLIVVVGKARNLPNKSRFGKQDPFCTIQFLEEKKRTKTIKRGGQHPEWDDELRFTIMEELEDILKPSRSESLADSTVSSSASLASVASNSSPGVTTAQALAAKSRRPLKKGGGKNMRVACYADDPKEPELIGDCYVQIDEVLRKGEVDEWYEFTYKEKYVGEIYLELTFYSNDAPPVKRNVPKPSTQNYGGAGVFHDGNMSTSSSLSGRLSASGSASGMNLYIPPYAAQHAVAPTSQPYGSFGNLGLPPSMNEGQDFAAGPSGSPASFAPAIVPSATLQSVDSLGRPFSAMSLGAPATPPKTIKPSASTQNLNRHSLGVSDAPWQSLLPQSQPTVAVPPSRPMSTNDALPWEQAKRLEDERRRAGATPVPRPMSGQGFGTPPGLIRPGDTIPTALQAGSPIRHQHAHSFSYADRPVVTSLLHSTSPSPAPPPLATSAPPLLPTNTYQQSPLSSFERVALALNTSQSSLGQSPLSSRPQSVHDPLQTPVAAYQPTPPRLAQDYPAPSSAPAGTGTPNRINAYQQIYGQDGRQSVTPPPQSFTQSLPQTPQNHPYAQVPSHPQPSSYQGAHDAPLPQPTPPPAPQQYSTPSGNYVPWYQQTQSAQSSAGPSVPPRPSTSTPTPYAEPTPPRPAFGPPPVPSRRPVPTPPGPPQPGPGRGYYPSDELYIRSVNEVSEVYSPSGPSHTPQPGPSTSPGPSQYNPPHRPYHDDQTYHDPSNDQQAYQHYNIPQHSYAPPVPSNRPGENAVPDRSTTPLGIPPQGQPLRTSTPLGEPPQGFFGGPAGPQTPLRSTTPMVPPQEYNTPQIYPDPPQQPYIDYARASSPAPAQTYTPPPRHPYAQAQSIPPLPPPRSASPLPPPQRFDHANSSPHTPTHLGPLPAAKSPLVNHHQSFPPSPAPERPNRNSWKDYMQSLPASSAGGGGISGVSGATGVQAQTYAGQDYSPSAPYPGVADDTGAGQYGEARMPGGFGAATLSGSPIHSKPPRPEGWRSTLPAQVNGHKWRG